DREAGMTDHVARNEAEATSSYHARSRPGVGTAVSRGIAMGMRSDSARSQVRLIDTFRYPIVIDHRDAKGERGHLRSRRGSPGSRSTNWNNSALNPPRAPRNAVSDPQRRRHRKPSRARGSDQRL